MSVQSICQDSSGFIWIGTARGLNRYDGVNFKHYFFSDGTSSLSHDFIGGLMISRDNRLYCSTSYGLNYYDLEQERMVRIHNTNERIFALVEWNNQIYSSGLHGGVNVLDKANSTMVTVPGIDRDLIICDLLPDGGNGLWCLTNSDNTLLQFDPEKQILRKYTPVQSDSDSDFLMTRPIARSGNFLLIGTNNGLLVFDIPSRKFIPLQASWTCLNSLKSKSITLIKVFENGMIYFGTREHGLFSFDLNDPGLRNYRKTQDNNGLKSDFVTSLFRDRDNNLWTGTFDHGIDVSFQKRKNFNTDLQLNELVKERFITCIAAAKEGHYYIGTRYDGLILYDAIHKTSSFINSRTHSILSNHIRSLFLDSSGHLWIGTEKKLYLLNPVTGKLQGIQCPEPNNGVVCFSESGGRIFAGTDAQGLVVYDLSGQMTDSIKNQGINITQIVCPEENKLLFSSYGIGIFEMDYPAKIATRISERFNIPDRRHIETVTMYMASDGELWIGNFNYGLFRFNLVTGQFQSYTTRDGLPSNDITAIMEDSDHYLWVSTAYGLSRFDKKEGFINFNLNEGVENLQFHQKAVCQDSNGTIFFGGNYGLTYFNPQNLGIHLTSSPGIVLETLRVANLPVLPGDNTGILTRNIGSTSQIRLSHKFPVFSIEYIAFDYIAAKNLNYAYKLEGFEDEWNYVSNRNYASYSNLDPGDYVFTVKAQNNNGIWSEKPVELSIRIVPAPWKTIWARISYLLLLLTGLFIAFQLVLRAKLFKKELEVEHNERLREKEINQMKVRFFTNISHEIRTPLTLIKGNVEQITTAVRNTLTDDTPVKSLNYNTERLLKLVNELLSFRKLENDNLGLEIARKDLITVSRQIVDSFSYLASTKKIDLSLRSDISSLEIPLDQESYEKILSNLVSNAIKFSNYHSQVCIRISFPAAERLAAYPSLPAQSHRSGNSFVEILVEDHGKGIPESVLPQIFDRYMQSGHTKTGKPDYSGTGIGLYFTKRLVELHKGYILASSVVNSLTQFSFVLPTNEKAYRKEDWITTAIEGKLLVMPSISVGNSLGDPGQERITVLIVEDDAELNRFICSSLSKSYTILSAFDGEAAFKIAKNQLPDLIISDIMMPKVDGITLCKQIRQDELISHIPIILLTAKTDMESQKAGLKTGADDYISKPFEMDLLSARIENLHHQRIRLRKTYQKGSIEGLTPSELNKFEFNFMKRIDLILQSEYQKPEFNVQVLADRINMSRTNFYRKFMSITSITPKDYLTRFRIEKAVKRMQEGMDNFGEISFLCGFSSQSIFTLSFKKVKGLTPLTFRKEHIHQS